MSPEFQRPPQNTPKVETSESAPRPLVVQQFPKEFRLGLRDYLQKQNKTIKFIQFFMSSDEYAGQKFMDEIAESKNMPSTTLLTPFTKNFSGVYEKAVKNGFDGNIDDVLFRWIHLDSTDEIEEVVRESETNGGMPVHMENEGALNMSDRTGRVDKAFMYSIKDNQSGVLFMYDGRMLSRLDSEEKDRSGKFIAGFGYKPKNSNSYRNALLGLIVLP